MTLLAIMEFIKASNKRERYIFGSVIALALFYMMEALNYELELAETTFFITAGFILFMVVQSYLAIKNMETGLLAGGQMAEIEKELAASAVESFAKYLRANMDSLKQKTPVPFEKELEHLEHYPFIEKLRFDDIEIVYDFHTKDFTIPSLTVQPCN